jgi:hypothetical protein
MKIFIHTTTSTAREQKAALAPLSRYLPRLKINTSEPAKVVVRREGCVEPPKSAKYQRLIPGNS